MAAALISVVVLAIAIIMVQQQRLFNDNEDVRIADEGARMAFDQVKRSIRRAGFGMDPELAVDFQNYDCSEYAGAALALTANGAGAAQCTNPPVRESSTEADQLVLYHRDPDYQLWSPDGGQATPKGHVWVATGLTTNSITVSGYPTDPLLRMGQILLVTCNNGALYTYVTLAANSTSSGSAATLSLDTSKNDPFHQQSAVLTTCPANQTYVFKIDRERYFIAQPPASGGVGHPFLMLDTGTDVDGNGTIDDKDLIPIASDVVDMQVAYEFAQRSGSTLIDAANTTAPDSVLYDDTGDDGIAQPAILARTDARTCQSNGNPYYECLTYFDLPASDPQRFNSDPANIVSIRVGFVVRTAAPNPQLRATNQFKQIPALFDRPAVLATSNLNGSCPAGVDSVCDGFRYSVVVLGEATPNLGSRGLFVW